MQCSRRGANGVDRSGRYAVVGYVTDFGSKDYDPACGNGTGKRHKSRLVKAKVMNAVNDDHAGCIVHAAWGIKTCGNGTLLALNGGGGFVDGMSVEISEHTVASTVGDALQQGGGAQVAQGKRCSSGECKDEYDRETDASKSACAFRDHGFERTAKQ